MPKILDRLAVEIFNTHIDSLSGARKLAERLLDLLEVEKGHRRSILEDIQLTLAEPIQHRLLRDAYRLTPLEALLLEYLIKREVLSRESVMALTQANNQTCRVLISRLRIKTGLSIANYRGEGYALRVDVRKALLSQLNKGELK